MLRQVDHLSPEVRNEIGQKPGKKVISELNAARVYALRRSSPIMSPKTITFSTFTTMIG